MRIGIGGIDGRMGRAIRAAAESVPDDVEIVGGTARETRARDGESVLVASDPATLVGQIDVFIDVSTPEAMLAHIAAMTAGRVPYVSGVTGIGAEHETALDQAAVTIPALYAANFSVGVATVAELLRIAAAALPLADVEIVEMHHRRKKDAPSGTALHFLDVIEGARSDRESRRVYGREGASLRQPGDIGVHSLRGGGNAGEHWVVFASEGEEVTIEHRALSRSTFADGALRAAGWLVNQPLGRYSMRDVIAGSFSDG